MSRLNSFNFNNVFVYVVWIIKLCQINPYFWYNDPQLASMNDVFTRYLKFVEWDIKCVSA